MTGTNTAARDSKTNSVVRLPTAAPRKVNNGRFAEQRKASRALKDQTAHRFNHIFPTIRAQLPAAKAIKSMAQTTELLLIEELFSYLGRDAIEAIAARLAARREAYPDCQHTEAAHSFVSAKAPKTFGDQVSLFAALDILERDQ